MAQPSEPWTDEKRASYLRSVRERLGGLPIMLAALEKGTLADPYAIPHEIRRAVAELEAVLASYD